MLSLSLSIDLCCFSTEVEFPADLKCCLASRNFPAKLVLFPVLKLYPSLLSKTSSFFFSPSPLILILSTNANSGSNSIISSVFYPSTSFSLMIWCSILPISATAIACLVKSALYSFRCWCASLVSCESLRLSLPDGWMDLAAHLPLDAQYPRPCPQSCEESLLQCWASS